MEKWKAEKREERHLACKLDYGQPWSMLWKLHSSAGHAASVCCMLLVARCTLHAASGHWLLFSVRWPVMCEKWQLCQRPHARVNCIIQKLCGKNKSHSAWTGARDWGMNESDRDGRRRWAVGRVTLNYAKDGNDLEAANCSTRN